ncbi:GNAT family N-acetyltransferase [Flavobacterium qiangtangense]|uniref:GNAT family N-acetyltransferase n=1 Tax=Flavobacterium qiangtangense TaxID=1442595 RepID=A0ABW1PT89_9FLAO
MQIRPFQTSDTPRLLELLRLNTPEYFSPAEEKDLIYYLKNEIEQYFVLLENNKIIGCGGFNLSEDKKTGKISWDIFHPESQGKGFGTELTNYRIERIKEIKSIEKISVRTSQLAFRFYAKFGFQLKEIVKNYWDKGFDLYHLEANIDLVKIR